MDKVYFGLSIDIDGLNSQDVTSRLFICPRISPDHALKMLDMLKTGKLSVSKFVDMTNTYIEELQSLTSDLAVQTFSHSMVEIIGASVDDGTQTKLMRTTLF